MDGFCLDKKKAGAAVVQFDRKLDKKQEKRHFLEKNKDLFDTELQTILDTLALSIKRTRNVGLIIVTVFTNSQTAITKIWDLKTRVNGDVVQNLVYQNAQVNKNTGQTLVLR